MIRVLIVDDSKIERDLLTRIINSDEQLQVIGAVGDGKSAIQAVKQYKPDVVTMNIHIPKMDGIEATREMMMSSPVPIIMIANNYDSEDVEYSFKAIEAGALIVVKKPVPFNHPDHKREANILIKYIKLMSEIRVIRRYHQVPIKAAQSVIQKVENAENGMIRVIAIGGSTGGTAVIGKILSGLPKDFSIPILIVQHMSVGFTKCFCTWLSSTSGYAVTIAQNGEILMPGKAYLAPDDFHMTVTSGQHIQLLNEEAENGLRPSVNYLFESVAEQYGSSALGILLTGMGSDGAAGLLKMKNRGAMTVAQDSESSVVYGMPGEAVKKGAVQYSLDPDRMIELIKGLK